jgi:hypothetical protein
MEDMYDFGKLGKWSLSTLKANMEEKYGWHSKILVVESIEALYRKLYKKTNLFNRVFFMRIHELRFFLNNMDFNDELRNDYTKYNGVMKVLHVDNQPD